MVGEGGMEKEKRVMSRPIEVLSGRRYVVLSWYDLAIRLMIVDRIVNARWWAVGLFGDDWDYLYDMEPVIDW